jgi:hypothetical protein
VLDLVEALMNIYNEILVINYFKPFQYDVVCKFPDWPPEVRTANGTALCH